jgi:hypothetical protein
MGSEHKYDLPKALLFLKQRHPPFLNSDATRKRKKKKKKAKIGKSRPNLPLFLSPSPLCLFIFTATK